MNNLLFKIDGSGVKKEELLRLLSDKDSENSEKSRLETELAGLRAVSGKGLETKYGFLNLCDQEIKEVLDLAELFKGVDLLIVIGIGGSNLGTMAVQRALLGTEYNDLVFAGLLKGPRIYYADTVDARSMERISSLMKGLVKKGGKVLLNVISKSGSTTETIANFALLLDELKKANSDTDSIGSSVVVTTGKGSKLWSYAKSNGFYCLVIPESVGGRYSVLSPVGLFPLAVLGIDIGALLKGAGEMRERCLKEMDENPAVLSALLHKYHLVKGRSIANTFLFSKDLNGVGLWLRQLMAESLGKEWNIDKTKKVNTGLTPTVSIGSTDLHSQVQLYLGGPDDKFFTFVTVDDVGAGMDVGLTSGAGSDVSVATVELKVPKSGEFDELVPDIGGKRLTALMSAIAEGTMVAFRKAQRPYCSITIPRIDERSIGQLLQMKMVETVLLASLFGVNPFDQPSVEMYKEETRRILSGG